MKKTMAYVATAILLGLAVIMLPKALVTYTPQSEAPPAERTNDYKLSPDNQGLPFYGLGTRDLLPSSLVLLSGLIVALSLYVIIRRRTI